MILYKKAFVNTFSPYYQKYKLVYSYCGKTLFMVIFLEEYSRKNIKENIKKNNRKAKEKFVQYARTKMIIDLQKQLEDIKTEALMSLEKTANLKDMEDFRVTTFGKKGKLAGLMKNLGGLSKEERPAFGQLVNAVRDQLETAFEEKQKQMKHAEMLISLEKEKIDVTISGKAFEIGKKHPLTTVMDEIKSIFLGMGYQIAEGPDIETSYYNFDALNIPDTHPSKSESDTFYIRQNGEEFLLRTQTSPVQVRTIEQAVKENNLPIKIIAPGRVYRPDEVDATHSPIFHQIEGLVVDRGINMANLKATLTTFVREFFGESTRVRFRPHHFPFTEPSAELDISCFKCLSAQETEPDPACKVCRGEGYIELLGCGMVHPNVLRMSGIDPTEYSGFAFGMGLERTAMQRYNVQDLRLFFENDVKFLKQL